MMLKYFVLLKIIGLNTSFKDLNGHRAECLGLEGIF